MNLRPWLRDAAALVGAAFIVYGVGMVYRPAAFIVAGAMTITACVLLARGEGT